MMTIITLSDTILLSNDIYEYHYVSQGKIDIPGVDDAREFLDTHVSLTWSHGEPQFY